MTPQEQQLLTELTTRVNSTVLHDKDPEAEQFLGQSLGRNPDALYILAQTVLVQQYALDQAKKQLAEAPAPEPEKHTSFLGNLLGMEDNRPAPPPPPRPQSYQSPQYEPLNNGMQPQYATVAQATQYAAAAQYAQPQYAPPQYGQGAPGGGSFLRSAMQTATGVAAGALAFQGIESLMHGFGNHAGYSGSGSGFGNFGGGGGGREEVVNNYYGDSGREHSGGGISPDIEDRRDNTMYDTSLADNDPDDFGPADNTDTSADTSLADNDPDDFGPSDNNS